MPLAKEIMMGGHSAIGADAMAGQVKPGISAAGTSATDATPLTASLNLVTTVASNTGVILLNCEIGDSQKVYQTGANPLKVYPPTSTQQINQLSPGAAATLAANTLVEYQRWSATQWVAQLSA